MSKALATDAGLPVGARRGGPAAGLSGAGPRYARQRTLKSPIHCSGVALHSGQRVALSLRPAEPNTGIVFSRSDVDGREALIPASWRNVVDTTMCTVLANEDGDSIGTVEHVMAALAGCGIDNLHVDVHGPEVPIMDGSSEPFVFLIDCAGSEEQDAPRRGIRVLKDVTVGDETRNASLSPASGFSVSFRIDFDTPAIATQETTVNLVNGAFKQDISRARTFGFLEDVEKLKAMGLARGGSLENAIVVSGGQILNQDGLRYDDEFVRHKVLDSIGDLYLAGAPITGHFHGQLSGHRHNRELLESLFADDDAWCYTWLDRRTGSAVGANLPPKTAAAYG